MKKLFLFLLLLVIFFSGALAQKKGRHHKATKEGTQGGKNIIKYGTASFYATKFNGRKTASGPRYNSTKYTAACNVLPLNTRIKVTNLKNQKSIIVVVNDRMRAKNKRLIDLSKDAATKLGYIGKGLTRVKIEVLPGFQSPARS